MKQALVIANMVFASVSTFGAFAENVFSNEQSGNGRTPLTQAVYNNKWDSIFTLVNEEKADVNQSDKNGETPLTIAVKLQDQELCEMLVLSGADLNQPDERGDTPLTLAAELQDQQLYNKLTELQAEPTMFDMDNGWYDLDTLCSEALKKNAEIRESIDKEDSTKTEGNKKTFTFMGFIKDTVGFIKDTVLSWWSR